MIRRVIGIYYSPVGGTARMTRSLTEGLAGLLDDCNPDGVRSELIDLMHGSDSVELDDETVAVIGLPVYIGKLPLPALGALDRINSNGAFTAVVVSYGGSSYGNALYELQHYAEEHDFSVIGAGAFAVRYRRHRGRSAFENGIDADSMKSFGSALGSKIRRLAGCEIDGLRIKPAPVEVSGRLPVHRVSRLSPKAAEVAQGVLQRVSFIHKNSEWYL